MKTEALKKKGPVAPSPFPENIVKNESNTSPAEEKESSDKPDNQKKLAWRYGTEYFDLFVDRNAVAYAKEKSNPRTIFEIESPEFRRRLLNGLRKSKGVIADIAAINSALSALVAEAAEVGPIRDVFRRVGHRDGTIYFFLSRGSFVTITQNGWSVETTCPVDFIVPAGMLPLPIPTKDGSVDELKSILGIGDGDNWILISAFILGAMCPFSPTAALVLEGQQGSGKTMMARIIKALVDPEENDLRSIPHSERELFVLTRRRWLLAFDNLSGLGPHLQDALCRIITGASYSTRKLHSDYDEVNIAARMPIILNGIDSIATRPDLAERAISICLPTMSPTKRRVEKKIWEDFRRKQPGILGAFFTALSVALRWLPSAKLDPPPRMIDFALLVSAGEAALGHAKGAFVRAFEANQHETIKSGLEAYPAISVLADIIREMFDGLEEDSTTLLERINKEAGPEALRCKGWPKSPSALSGQIKRAIPILRAHGLEVIQDRTSAKRKWKFWRSGDAPKSLSSSSPPSFPGAKPVNDDDDDGYDDVQRGWEAKC